MQQKNYKLVIVGAGPAGASASVYAARFGIRHIVVGSILGGQISESHIVDNYVGIEDATGFEFAQKLGHHVQKYGTQIIPRLVKNIKKEKDYFRLDLGGEEKLEASAILLATGTQRRKLMLPGEEKFSGKGVSYCATCDGFFYKNKAVAVVGGSDSAAGAAVYLADIAQKVYLIYRGKKLRAEKHWVDLIEKKNNIEILLETNITELSGMEKLEKAALDKEYNGQKELLTEGLFIEAGSDPRADFARDLGVETDEQGYIKIKKDGATNIRGVWAAGDITDGSDKFRQVVTAAAEGAIAARSIYNYLKSEIQNKSEAIISQ